MHSQPSRSITLQTVLPWWERLISCKDCVILHWESFTTCHRQDHFPNNFSFLFIILIKFRLILIKREYIRNSILIQKVNEPLHLSVKQNFQNLLHYPIMLLHLVCTSTLTPSCGFYFYFLTGKRIPWEQHPSTKSMYPHTFVKKNIFLYIARQCRVTETAIRI